MKNVIRKGLFIIYSVTNRTLGIIEKWYMESIRFRSVFSLKYLLWFKESLKSRCMVVLWWSRAGLDGNDSEFWKLQIEKRKI